MLRSAFGVHVELAPMRRGLVIGCVGKRERRFGRHYQSRRQQEV